jgi:hypothetical protein
MNFIFQGSVVLMNVFFFYPRPIEPRIREALAGQPVMQLQTLRNSFGWR